MRQDWKQYNIKAVCSPALSFYAKWINGALSQMETAIWHKFAQHRELKEELLATGDAELIEVCGGRLTSSPLPLASHRKIRTPTRTRFGVVVLMERARTS